MKTFTRITMPLAVVAVLVATSSTSFAKGPRSFFKNPNLNNHGPTFNVGKLANHFGVKNFAGNHLGGKKFGGKHFGGKHITLPSLPIGAPPPSGGGIGSNCPPPPPPPCRVYFVYYYDCHFGWRLYGEYRSRFGAEAAVYHLQFQGYRTYMVRR